MNKKITWIIILVLILGGVWWWGGQKSEAPVDVAEVKIGLLMPLTGPRADGGEFARNALIIATEEIGAGKNRKFKLAPIYEDSQYDPKVAVSGLTKLINLDGVNFVIGPHGSSEVLAAAPVAEQNKILMLVPAAQSDEISDAGDYIFRVIHNSAQEAPMSAAFVAKNMKGDSLPFLALNTAITDSYLKNFTPTFEAAGKKIGVVERFSSTAGDFRTELLKIKAAQPLEIFLIATPKHAGLILKQADELGLKAQFYNIGVEGPELITVAGPLADGLIYPYSYDVDNDEPRVKAFASAYQARFGGAPDTVAANVYDSAYLLSDCFERVGVKVEVVKLCLYGTSNFTGASGTFSIDERGDAIKNIFFKTIKNGQFVRLEE